jgi:hypothetical protein
MTSRAIEKSLPPQGFVRSRVTTCYLCRHRAGQSDALTSPDNERSPRSRRERRRWRPRCSSWQIARIEMARCGRSASGRDSAVRAPDPENSGINKKTGCFERFAAAPTRRPPRGPGLAHQEQSDVNFDQKATRGTRGKLMVRLQTLTARALLIAIALAAACGGSSSTLGGAGGGPGGGSAVCGPNGTNTCRPNQQCDPTLGCVECTSDSQCPAVARFCLAGGCVTCKSDTDCGGATPACWPADHTCHAACGQNQSCPRRAAICTSTGDCVGCNTAADCPSSARVCSASRQQCVQCAADGDCPASQPRCNASNGTCVQCVSNADCGTSAPVCDPLLFACRAGCTSDAQCPAARPHCDLMAAQCTPGCSGDSQCPQVAPHCSAVTARCVQCVTSGDCAGTATPICSSRQRCVECATDMDCPAATPFCAGGGNGPRCEQCVQDNQCPQSAPNCNNGTCGQ